MNGYSTPDIKPSDTNQNSLDNLTFYDLALKLVEAQDELNDLQQKIYNIQERMRKQVNESKDIFVGTSKAIVTKTNNYPILVETTPSDEFVVTAHPDLNILSLEISKQFIQDIKEYRKWAWDISSRCDNNYIDNALGIIKTYSCFDQTENDKGELVDIDEHGNIIPPDTEYNVPLENWVNELMFPVVAVYCFTQTSDRLGSVQFCFCEFVSFYEFKKYIPSL